MNAPLYKQKKDFDTSQSSQGGPPASLQSWQFEGSDSYIIFKKLWIV